MLAEAKRNFLDQVDPWDKNLEWRETMANAKTAAVLSMVGALSLASYGSANAAPLTPLSAAAKPTAQETGAVKVRWGGWGWGVGAGVLAGALIGAAITAPYAYGGYYPYYGYGYGYPSYSYGYGGYYPGYAYAGYYPRYAYGGYYPRYSYYRPHYRFYAYRSYYRPYAYNRPFYRYRSYAWHRPYYRHRYAYGRY
jgi:hypothetical protein